MSLYFWSFVSGHPAFAEVWVLFRLIKSICSSSICLLPVSLHSVPSAPTTHGDSTSGCWTKIEPLRSQTDATRLLMNCDCVGIFFTPYSAFQSSGCRAPAAFQSSLLISGWITAATETSSTPTTALTRQADLALSLFRAVSVFVFFCFFCFLPSSWGF